MKPKNKLELIYSVTSILDALISLGFVLLTCDFVAETVSSGFGGLLLFIMYGVICFGSSLVRNLYLLNRYLKEIEELKQKNQKEHKKKECPLYLFPLFAMVACLLSISIIFL